MTAKTISRALSRSMAAAALVTVLSAQELSSVRVNAASPKPGAEMDPTILRGKAMQVMETYCFSCHGAEKQKGDIRFDAMDSIDQVDLQDLFADAKKALQLGEMPPEEARIQPGKEERELLVKWLETQVTGDAAKALAEKLKRFEYGNVVDHSELFSGKHAGLPGSTPDRRWLVSEFIFNDKVNSLLDYVPTRTVYGKPMK